MTKIIVTEKGQNDTIFYRGNLVIGCFGEIVMVDISVDKDNFVGTSLRETNLEHLGTYRTWSKSIFRQFNGFITLEVK